MCSKFSCFWISWNHVDTFINSRIVFVSLGKGRRNIHFVKTCATSRRKLQKHYRACTLLMSMKFRCRPLRKVLNESTDVFIINHTQKQLWWKYQISPYILTKEEKLDHPHLIFIYLFNILEYRNFIWFLVFKNNIDRYKGYGHSWMQLTDSSPVSTSP